MIHPTAEVDPSARLGPGTRVWHQAQIRENAVLGANCIVGKGAYIDRDVHIGDNAKIENGAFVYRGTTLEEGVFVGPGACLANDKHPRAITPDGRLKTEADWQGGKTLVKYGASIGAGALVLPDVVIGRWAMVGAAAVVTRNVPDHALVVGSPARLAGYACRCGHPLEQDQGRGCWACPTCEATYDFAPLGAKASQG